MRGTVGVILQMLGGLLGLAGTFWLLIAAWNHWGCLMWCAGPLVGLVGTLIGAAGFAVMEKKQEEKLP